MNEIGKCLLAVTVFLASNSPGFSQSYFCIQEAAGGLKPLNGEWSGTAFKPSGKYLVARDPENQKEWTVTEIGKTYALHRCPVIMTSENVEADQIICGGLGYGMVINFAVMRYVEVYTFGYINNDKSGNNTPSVSGGMCSKIN
ncbi:hypothetical protein [Agrobacterium rubi]|uniref:hypothetical protein n=1 Tax=Agrobacterium rubi TaxID=28099 RepID=UPI001571FE41|nr:hypothetical protein [Agrobacterium rubi]NTE87238.1 hypothetical protein [Agrobacterium rubi]NTF03172.1 hypothetical protein [Agrobacterium rubi]